MYAAGASTNGPANICARVAGWPNLSGLPRSAKYSLRRRVLKLVRWRSSRKAAAQATEEVIRRARTKASGEWEGNVYKPDSFKRPRKPH